MFEDDSKVRQEIRKLRKRVKKSPLLFARLGDCYLQLGDWDRARKVLEPGVEAHPDYTSGLKILGEGYLLNGHYGDAADCAARGLETDPNHLGLLQIMEKAKKKLEEADEANKFRDRMNTLDPLLYVHLDETDEPIHSEAPAETTETSEKVAGEAPEDDFVEDIKKSAAPKSAKKAEPKPEVAEGKKPSPETEEILAEDDEEASEINKMIEEIKSSGVPETTEEAEPLAEAEESEAKETDSVEVSEEPVQAKQDTQPEVPESEPQMTEEPKDEKPTPKADSPADEDTDPFGLEEVDEQATSRSGAVIPPEEQSADTAEVTSKDDTAEIEGERTAPEPAKTKKYPSKKESTKSKAAPTKKPTAAESVETAPVTGEAVPAPSEPAEKAENPTETEEAAPSAEKPKGKKKKIATKTLGELYATQQKYEEAIEIYEKLLEKDPDNNDFKKRLEDLKSRREEALSTSTD